MRLFHRKSTDDGYVKILSVKNGAVLGQRRDGSKVCAHCPFCCLATYERCEFSDRATSPGSGS